MAKKLFIIFLFFLFSCKGEWNYENSDKWGNDEKNKFCKIGYNQSPINIEQEFEVPEISFDYKNSTVEKEQKNFATYVNFDGQNFLYRGKKKYLLRSIIFHHPSEHLVNGKAFSLEMQIMHKSEDEQWLVIALFLEVGKDNPEFKTLVDFITKKKKDGVINLSKIIKKGDAAFFYDGSFTTPPCTEGVKWYVMKTPLKISQDQMNKIIKSAIAVKSNARPVQKFNPEKY